MKSITFTTIGCKLNQFETEQMREAVEICGHRTCPVYEKADVYVINTCTVTSKSDYRSRQAIRRAIRSNPQALIIVTGCYAQRSAQEVGVVSGVDIVLGNAEKEDITQYVTLGKREYPLVRTAERVHVTKLESKRHLRGFGRYTRAFVKIQDGAVPLARGRSRSKSIQDVIAEIQTLVQAGYKEIVLTGVHLGSYGRDLVPAVSLARLIEQIYPIDELQRIRLSSIEPTDFDDHLIDTISDHLPKICPHVHIPLQSGDNRILDLMHRRYTQSQYSELIHKIADRIPFCGIGADVMVGFPGEDSKAFMNTYNLLRDLPVTYLHVFSFSRRPGTEAFDLPDDVEPEEKKRRSRLIRRLGRRKAALFRRTLVGEELEIIVLGAEASWSSVGLTGNYVKAFLKNVMPANAVLRSRVLKPLGEGILATAVQAELEMPR
jgi:threonylcarbamoyladenosine tRNA methylthiotransferase MtaB